MFTNSLDHVFDLESTLNEVARVLASDGLFLVEAVDGSLRYRGEYESFWWQTIDALKEAICRCGWVSTNEMQFDKPWPGHQISFRKYSKESKRRRAQYPLRAQALIKVLNAHFGNRDIVGAEIGVWRGELSRCLLEEISNLSLYLVDPWRSFADYHAEGMIAYSEEGWHDALEETRNAVSRFSQRAIIKRLTSSEAAKQIADRSLDFVFIDANHAYDHVVTDLDLWTLKVKSFGIICGHDYHMESVRRAVNNKFGRINGGGEDQNYVWWTVLSRNQVKPIAHLFDSTSDLNA